MSKISFPMVEKESLSTKLYNSKKISEIIDL